MQERERARLQKMGTSILQTDSLRQSAKRRSFSLPSFRRYSSAGERQLEVARKEEEMAMSGEEEAARVQKAAAWQWYTRGVGEAVLPTKRPHVGKSPPSQAPLDDKSVVHGRSKAISNNSNVLQKKPLEPPLAESPRASSRFKAEAKFARPTNAGAQPAIAPSVPSDGPFIPLYDEFELSGLRTQMADFVQRLQVHQQTKDNQQSPTQKSNPRQIAVDGRPLPAATSVSTDQQFTKAPPSAAAAISRDHQLTKPPPSAAPVASTIPFHMRPFSALHRLFRKVVSGSIIKSTTNSPLIINSSLAVYEPEVIPDEEEENTPYHYHHYIHHHHHHYHYGQSPEEGAAAIIHSRRRHSESSGILPHMPSLWEAESDEEEEEVERSSIEAYLARRRRHSDSFAGLQLPRRYNSNKIPTVESKDLAQPTKDEFDEGFPEIRSRRRHSTENQQEGVSLEGKAEGGGKSGGATYKLGRAADYATPAKPLVRRRHSEGLQRPEGDHHYHYGPGPEESAVAIIRSRRRYSESSGIIPHIPSLLAAESDEEEEEVERSSIESYLARRRRHSDSFAGHLTPQKAAFDEEEEMNGESAKELRRRYVHSNKIPTMVSEDLAQPSKDEFDKGFPEIRSTRRHSAESNKREEADLERKAEGGRGMSGGGIYKLGGAADGHETPAKPLVQRRHSEGLQRPEGAGASAIANAASIQNKNLIFSKLY